MLGRWWRAWQRRIDMLILWPSCRSAASDIESARGAFFVHAMLDTAWTRDMSENEIMAFCKTLK